MPRLLPIAVAATCLIGAPLVVVALTARNDVPAAPRAAAASRAPSGSASSASTGGRASRLVIRHRDRRVVAGAWVGRPVRTRALREMVAAPPRVGPVVLRRERALGDADAARVPLSRVPSIDRRRATAPPVLGAAGAVTPLLTTVFSGIDLDHAGSGGFPADPTMDVSPTQVVEMVNTAIAVYDRNGSPLLPAPISFATFFPAQSACAVDAGDPIVLWDDTASRWLVTQFTAPPDGVTNQLCVAASVTDDATGAWNVYVLDNPNPGHFLDYPKWGIAPDGYYVGAIDFGADAVPFIGVIDRQAVLAGSATVAFKFTARGDPRLQAGLYLPADVEGASVPAGPGSVFSGLLASDRGNGSDGVQLVRVDPSWANPAADLIIGVATVQTQKVPTILCGGNDNCVSQKGYDPNKKQGLDPLSDRLLSRASYRRIALPGGGFRESLLLTQTVNPGGNELATPRWLEIADAFTAPHLVQQGLYAPPVAAGQYRERWMGSAAMNAFGAIAVGFSASGSDLYPSVGVAGRTDGDRPGNLGPENIFARGTGLAFAGQLGTTPPADFTNRWGDYSQLVVDPDGCTFWYVNMTTPGPGDWKTSIGHLSVGSCAPFAAPVLANAPKVIGTPRVGRRVTCTVGSWTAQPPIRAYAAKVSWKRGSRTVGSGATRTVTRADVGRKLSCSVTVTNAVGSGRATSRGVTARR
jgi:hypothetical protein